MFERTVVKLFLDEGNLLVGTDYYLSDAYREGKPCCLVREATWHLLLPETGSVINGNTRFAWALPVVAKDQPEGWAWRLMMRKGWTVRVPLSCFLFPVPSLPRPGDEYRQALVIYGRWLPGLATRPMLDVMAIEQEAPAVLFSAVLMVQRRRVEEIERLGGKMPGTYT